MYKSKELSDIVNEHISKLNFNPSVPRLYEPISYVLGLGGKRIRPVLMLMSYNLYNESVDEIINAALGLEVYHNFTLLHDDLMDNADMRRGHATVHKKWDDNTAILSGDAMLIMAYEQMTKVCHSQHFNKALSTFNDATLGVCEGQQLDMDFESRNDVTTDEYMEMIRLKTSLLLACALKIGAQLAGASEEDCESLYKFGEKMGLAFQLQDDLLDVYGDPAVFGKNIGGDIMCNKKTYMLISASLLAKGPISEDLKRWIADSDAKPEEKIPAVTNIYNTLGVKALCDEKIQALFSESLNFLDAVNVPNERKEELRKFAHTMMGRKY